MPVRNRHNVRTIQAAAIATGSNSPSFSAQEADGLLIYLTASAGTVTATLQGSSDGGTTWFTLETFSPGSAANFVYRAIFPVPGLCRIAVGGTGSITNLAAEICRSF
jgi:hypothetical protein